MKKFRLVDNVMGWLAFLIAAVVYCSTIEPTASFWDCPEFITTGYRLEVGHPPGAPFFALTANLFSQFVSDPSQVARMVNTMSALLSATCIMFLFWTISHLARKLIVRDGETIELGKLIAIEGSALVGALVYTFSDTFWFSAVEGEVYAYSSAFTAVVFWLILKWEDNADKPHADRWLVLITYMTGLSIGVHLLNLLCIPAIVLVFYYHKFPDANASRLSAGAIRVDRARGSRALWRRSRHHHRRRMVRTALHQHLRHAVQHRYNIIYPTAHRLVRVGHLRNLQEQQRQT